MRRVIFFVFLFVSCTNVSNNSNKKEELLQKLRSADRYEEAFIGVAAEKSELYNDAYELMSLCSDRELLKLLKDKSPVVKCYAASFVEDKNIKANWYNILLKETEDYSKIKQLSGCFCSEDYTGDLMLDFLFNKKLTEAEQNKMKLAMVKKQSRLNFAKSILLGEEMSGELYAAEREWALRGSPIAIFSLAKYKKDEDLDLMESLKLMNLDLFFKACQYNPRDSLKPFLKKYMLSIMPKEYFYSEWADFYKLVSAYHDSFTKEIFDMAFSGEVNPEIQRYHLEYIYDAIENCFDGFYDDYLKILWAKHNLVDKEIIDYFLLSDKESALEALKESLLNPAGYRCVFYFDDHPLDYMIKAAYKNKIDLTQYFVKAIKEYPVSSEFEIYMNNMDCVQAGSKEIVDAMKTRLENETNPHVAFPLCERLILLNDKSVNNFLVSLYEKNKDLYARYASGKYKSVWESLRLLKGR